MRRGRTFLILVIIIVIIIIAAVLVFRNLGAGINFGKPAATPTPGTRIIEIITAGQNIQPGTQITDAMLSTIRIPETDQVAGELTDKNVAIGQFAKLLISQGVPIMDSMISQTPGVSSEPGSPWATQIPQGLTAVSIPTSRLNSAAFGIRDNDYVNVIVSMLLIDVDASFQTALPNFTAGVQGAGPIKDALPFLTVQINSGGAASIQGRTELDPTLNNAVYVIPSENQRPRMVTQMIMQNIQVLHMGTFPLPGELTGTQTAENTGATPTAAGQAPQSVTRPDIITLMVTPQDAVVLTYLVYSGAQITLTLRNPNDFDFKTTTDAATLQYLLSQYNIPVPAKLPYSLQPRIDKLVPPVLPNDAVVVPAQ